MWQLLNSCAWRVSHAERSMRNGYRKSHLADADPILWRAEVALAGRPVAGEGHPICVDSWSVHISPRSERLARSCRAVPLELLGTREG